MEGTQHPQASAVDKFSSSIQAFLDGLTQKQADELLEAFPLLDKDGDGCLSREELTGVLPFLGLTTSPQEVDSCLVAADTDKDGLVSRAEFQDWIYSRVLPPPTLQLQLRKVFRLLDNTSRGVLSPADLQTALDELNEPLSSDETAEVVAAGDEDKDGALDENEFVNFLIDKV